MASVNKAQLPNHIRMDLIPTYEEGLQAGSDGAYLRLLRRETANSTAKEVVFLGDKGKLRRFRDERQPQTFNEYKYVATSEKWEMTHTIDRLDISNDQSGGTVIREVSNFGSAVASSLDEYTWEFLRNGASRKGFDKANLFDFNHRYVTSSGATVDAVAAQANMHLGGSQLDATTVQLLQDHFANVVSDKGKVMGMRLTDIAVRRGSDNAKTAREIANSTFTVEASTVKGQMTQNVFQGQFNIIEADYGFGSSEWFGFDLRDSNIRPIVMLEHANEPGIDSLEFTELTEDSHDGFWRDMWAYGVRGVFGWNVGDWRSAYMHGSSAYTFTADDLEDQAVGDPNA